MQTLSEIRQLLAARGLRPKHRLGQNFLHDKNQIVKLLEAADVREGEVVLEVGPGTGTLTGALLERGAVVIACEIDEGMAGIIEELFATYIREPGSVNPALATRGDTPRLASLTLIKGDALEKDRHLNRDIIAAIGGRKFKLVANLPYQIASPLMTTLLVDHSPRATGETPVPPIPVCTGQFVTIQKEVADRLMAKPGTKEYGPLSIIVQAFATVEKIGVLSPSCFWPPPEVTSAMVAINPHPSPFPSMGEGAALRTTGDRREFARFVVDVFTKRRKQLGTIFGRPPAFGEWPAGVAPDLRPEALTAEQLAALWRLAQAD